jgi:very-short-patch-repair endonuclease
VKGKLIPIARTLRKNQTDAEKLLWRKLRDRQLEGMKFRRQRPIGRYIVDLVCIEKKIVVEADGSQHYDNEGDKIRDGYLRNQGYTVLRFWNNEILKNIDGVIQRILEVVRAPSP